MDRIDRLVNYIISKAESECAETGHKAAEECARIKAEYSTREQDEYWKFIDAGSKETEQRMEKLNSLAEQESNKQILLSQQEMVSEAFSAAATRLGQLGAEEFAAITARLKLEGCSPAEVTEKFKNILFPRIMSVLYE